MYGTTWDKARLAIGSLNCDVTSKVNAVEILNKLETENTEIISMKPNDYFGGVRIDLQRPCRYGPHWQVKVMIGQRGLFYWKKIHPRNRTDGWLPITVEELKTMLLI